MEQTLEDLYFEELRDLYGAERCLAEVLPKIALRTEDARVREALRHHAEESRDQSARLERIFARHGMPALAASGAETEQLVAVSETAVPELADPMMRDVQVLAHTQRVEHFEIARCEIALHYAKALGYEIDTVDLERLLREETRASAYLNHLVGRELLPGRTRRRRTGRRPAGDQRRPRLSRSDD
jgi:ferritin-like metal-binding protein YciE